MKKVLLAMMLVFAGMTAFAQRGGGERTPEQRAENQTRMMTEKLGLSENQQKQIYALNLSRSQKMQEMRAAQNREGMRAQQENFRKELSAILTPEQQEKYKVMQQEMRRRGDVQRGDAQRGPNGQDLKKGQKDKKDKIGKRDKMPKKEHQHKSR